MLRKTPVALALVAAWGLCPSASSAQSSPVPTAAASAAALPPITNTATRTDRRADKVPVTVTVKPGDIKAAGARDIRDGQLLVDAPLAALDPCLQFELMDALLGFAQSRVHALVAVPHDLNQALAAFDRFWLVQDGRHIADLPADRSALAPLEQLFSIQWRGIDGDDGRLAVLASRCRLAAPGTVLAA